MTSILGRFRKNSRSAQDVQLTTMLPVAVVEDRDTPTEDLETKYLRQTALKSTLKSNNFGTKIPHLWQKT